MNLPPIPLIALPSSMTVRCRRGRGFDEPQTIDNVRYIDATNSIGVFDIPVGSLVSVDGKPERAVVKTTAQMGYGTIHHWKLEVR